MFAQQGVQLPDRGRKLFTVGANKIQWHGFTRLFGKQVMLPTY